MDKLFMDMVLNPEFAKKIFNKMVDFESRSLSLAVLIFLSPFKSPDLVEQETRKYMETLNGNGGHILMSSQTLEDDVPIENIEALFCAR